MTSRPRTASTSTAVVTPAAAPETSNATAAPAPPVASVTSAVTSSAVRVERAQPEALRERGPAVRVGLDHQDVGAACARRRMAMSRPTGPPPTTTARLARDQAGAAHVVDGDGGRLDQRGMLQRQRRGQPYQQRRPAPSSRACIEPGASMPRKTRFMADVGVARAGRPRSRRTAAPAAR